MLTPGIIVAVQIGGCIVFLFQKTKVKKNSFTIFSHVDIVTSRPRLPCGQPHGRMTWGVKTGSQALAVGRPNKNFASFQGKDCSGGL